MEKLEKDGKIAVLYSPGFGAGWSTWADESLREILTMDKDIAQAVLDKDIPKAVQIAEEKANGVYFYTGGSRDLTVSWIEKGTAFRINEYDGAESIEIISAISYMTA